MLTKNGKLLKHYTLDNFISIGGASAQVNPLAGEGIRHFLYSGRMAAEVISQAIKKKDFSQKQLSLYDRKWKDYVKDKWMLSSYLHKFIYSASDDLINNFLQTIGEIDKEEVLKIIWYYDKKAIGDLIIELTKKKIGDFKNEFLELFK